MGSQADVFGSKKTNPKQEVKEHDSHKNPPIVTFQ
jgi:hypothetical protein